MLADRGQQLAAQHRQRLYLADANNSTAMYTKVEVWAFLKKIQSRRHSISLKQLSQQWSATALVVH